MTQPQNQTEAQGQAQAQDQAQTEAQTQAQDSPERSYRWGELAMQFHIHWLESEEPGQPRKIMLSATTYDDGPIARLIEDVPLKDLVLQIQAMLAELEQSLPTREARWLQQASKQKKTQPKVVAATAPAKQADKPNPETQIKLF